MIKQVEDIKEVMTGPHVDCFISTDTEEVIYYLCGGHTRRGRSGGLGFMDAVAPTDFVQNAPGYGASVMHRKIKLKADCVDIPATDDERHRANIGFSPMAQLRFYTDGKIGYHIIIDRFVRTAVKDGLNVRVLNDGWTKAY